MAFTLPEAVVRRATNDGAEDWLAGLPAAVAGLEAEWSIACGAVLSGGSEALVVEATLADGTPAVLKLLLPHTQNEHGNEIAVLRHAGGEGCALLYRASEQQGAMLMERLGAPLAESGLSGREKLAILGETAQRLWRHPPLPGLMTGAEKARWLIDFIETEWVALGRPCSRRAVDLALECAQRRAAAHDQSRAVLVHGDIHEHNALKAAVGYKLVDPDGLFAEPESDLGVILRQPPWTRADAEWLAGRTGLDAGAAWEWAVTERVSTGLTCRKLGLEPFASEVLAAAEDAAAG
jgi:streptomycin 6-kinase